ncbi:hypothetical protein QTN47_11045 [Danxiaibacter flavus]|uniref:Lipoprotein n=1 Tax=Danxiaibacter flavus TaxID=3049108 RepID=A0ABV3ZEW7_9BACT|nr:hypothetical protein QNM32_11050 [Chitinophagaceae bacterium DXS]
MNKYAVLIFSVALFSSCDGRNAADDDLLPQKRFDSSQMEQKVSKVIQELKDDCDSTILELAKAKVDSIHKAKKLRKIHKK